MTRKIFILTISICLFLVGCKFKKQATNKVASNQQNVDYFADNGFGNAVAIVQHPAGVFHKGITYICYQGPLEDPYVASYNHKTKEWKRAI
jgi:hypothetical protein